MTITTRLIVAATLIVSPTIIALAQLNIAPPSTEPATQPETQRSPTTQAGNTSPSAQSVLDKLIVDKPRATTTPAIKTTPTTTTTSTARLPAIEAVAPNEPKAVRLHDGDVLQGTGRLIKDEKNNSYIFAFDSDGKQMYDPPVALLPCHRLETMEEAASKGARTIKFKISGEITEYQGKNYLHLRDWRVIRDLNEGIGG